jgi:hypothetical protein
MTDPPYAREYLTLYRDLATFAEAGLAPRLERAARASPSP